LTITCQYQDQTTTTYAYDCCRLNTVTDSIGTLTFTYDTLKRLSSLTDVYGKIISYSYDKNNNLTTLTYPGTKVVSYEYDKADRLIKVTDWLSNMTTYTYDSAGNLTKTNYPNGATIDYGYDNASRLKNIIDYKSDGSLNALFKYTHDSLGNRTLASFNQPLNAIPSQPDTNYTHDIDNRLLTAGSTSFEYDNNGNLIRKTVGSEIAEYSWDYNDMLTQLVSGGNTYIHRYDGLGNRVARIENSVERRYVSGLAETDSSGNITAYYVYGSGLISKITPSNQAYYYHFDAIGSTIAMSDSSGSIVNKYAYDAFGKVLNQEEAIPNPFKYVGGYGVMEEGNGLFYMRARYYDPEAGRFINKDPIGFLGGLNMYAYVGNNPVNWIDPLGLDFSTGVAFHVETVNPLTSGGGGIWGYNYQNNVLYSYSGRGIGLDIGGGVESVWAYGSGPWTGEFHSVNLGFFWFTGSIFWTPGKGGWIGVSFGLSPKTPIPTVAYEVTNYEPYEQTEPKPCP